MDTEDQFFQAIKNGDVSATTRLLGKQASLAAARDNTGLSAVLMAMYYQRSEIAKLLVAHGIELDIFEASAVGDLEQVRVLSEANPEQVNAYNIDGFHPLGLACFFGHLQVASLLVEKGAEINSPSRNPQSVMPLHSAVASRQVGIARMLIAHGADVNARQTQDFTPLHSAAQNGQTEMVQLLLTHGAEVDVRSAAGQAPYDLALEAGYSAIAEMLAKK